MNAMIRYHLNIDPKSLSEDEWIETWSGLKWILETQQDQLKQIYKNGK